MMTKMACAAFVTLGILAGCSSSSTPAAPAAPVVGCGLEYFSSCAIHYVLTPATGQPAACTAVLPDSTLALNTSATSYTATGGATCQQTFNGCALDRNCSSSTSAVTLTVTFQESAAESFSGTVDITASGVACTYAVSGGSCT